MTTTIVLASSLDGYIVTSDTDYNAAINGSNATAVNGGNEGAYGIGRSGADYDAFQTFLQFGYVRPTNEIEVGAAIGVRHSQHNSNTTSRDLYLLGSLHGTVDAGDWINPLAATVAGLFAQYVEAQASGTSTHIWSGSDELTNHLVTFGSTTLGFAAASNRQLGYDVNPALDEWSAIWLSETTLDPVMVVTTVPRSTLHGVMGCQVQLSDGTWAVLESDGASTPTVLLRHVNAAGTATTKATIPTSSAATSLVVNVTAGPQQLALVADSSDNLYVIGRSGGTENTLAVKAYTKGVGYTWTAQTTVTAAMPASDTVLNNFAAAWHSVGSGTLVIAASRATSDGHHGTSSEMVYAIAAAAAARAGYGTLLRSSGYALDVFAPVLGEQWATQTNDTGTGLDVTALSSTKGVVHTWSRKGVLGANQATTKARYTLNAGGTAFAGSFYTTPDGSSGTWGQKTAAGKLRVIPVAEDQAVTVSADPVDDWGLTVAALRNPGSQTSFTLLGRVRLDNELLTTMPTPAALSESAAWDAAYIAGPNKVWVYYFSVADGRRLMRTAVSLNTYTATREEEQVNASVGASGSTNVALRVTRGSYSTGAILVTVANRTSGGTLSTTYIVDHPNQAPTAPTLWTRSNFDGSASATFQWTFNDPDVGDTQSGFELDINSASGVDYYDTGHLTGTISFVGQGAASAANNASLTPALPAGWQAGDLLVLLASIRNAGTGTVNTPTGWRLLNPGSNGNFRMFGRIAMSGAASANNTPTVAFTSGAANATTLAQITAWRGTDQDINTVMTVSTAGTFTSAQNLPWSAITLPATNNVGIRAGWKQDDWTAPASTAGFTLAGSTTSTLGDDASMMWEYQTGTLGWFGGAWTITGGAAAISASLSIGIRPYQAPTASSFTLPASTLSQPGSWQWRVRTWDADSASSVWSDYATFNTGQGGTVTVTDPVADNPANVITSTYLVAWTLTGATQVDFRVVVKRTDTEAEVYNSGWVVSVATTHTISGLVSDVQHRIEVTTRTSGAVESQTGTRLITPSYAAPEEPLVTALENPTDGHTLIQVTNPTPAGDRPDADHTLILRRATTGPATGEAWVTIGAVGEDGEWRDFTAAAQITYEYLGRTVAADGSTTDSDPVDATLILQGTWIHDPSDPANAIDSAHHFPYGGAAGALEPDTGGAGTLYAGREFPVFDYGEHTTERLTGTAHIPHGTTWLDDLTALRGFITRRSTVCVRDGRGRRVFGVFRATESDQQWGTAVPWSVERVDYDETWTGSV